MARNSGELAGELSVIGIKKGVEYAQDQWPTDQEEHAQYQYAAVGGGAVKTAPL